MTLQPPNEDGVSAPDVLLSPAPKTAARPAIRFLLDHNPCFLLSAVSMFVGCFLINSALDVRTGDIGKLFALIGTINLYEAALLAVGLVLLRRARWNRDGVLLLLIQMLFLADGPFLLAETAMAGGPWAAAFNAGLFALAAIKAGIAMRALEIPLRARTLGFLMLQLILIYSVFPIYFARVAVDGVIGAGPMYLAWWIVGTLPALYELLAKLDALPAESIHQSVVRRAYLVVPWLLLIAHLGFFQYAYRAPFFAADLSPVFIGLAFATRRIRPFGWIKASDLPVLLFLLPAVAAILGLVGSNGDMYYQNETIFPSPGMLTLAAVFLTYAYFWSARMGAYAAGMFATIELLHIAGVTREMIWNALSLIAERVYRWALLLLPTTAIVWGILAITAAFGLLAIGSYHTLRRRGSA